MSDEPESLIFQMLRDMRAEMGDMRAEMTTKNDLADIRSEMHSFLADVTTDLIEVRRASGPGQALTAGRFSSAFPPRVAYAIVRP